MNNFREDIQNTLKIKKQRLSYTKNIIEKPLNNYIHVILRQHE